VEFLEYLAPRDGRPMPLDERANDLIHWHTAMTAEVERAVRLRDPDGHVIELSRPTDSLTRQDAR
jgi:hypothetical protein